MKGLGSQGNTQIMSMHLLYERIVVLCLSIQFIRCSKNKSIKVAAMTDQSVLHWSNDDGIQYMWHEHWVQDILSYHVYWRTQLDGNTHQFFAEPHRHSCWCSAWYPSWETSDMGAPLPSATELQSKRTCEFPSEKESEQCNKNNLDRFYRLLVGIFDFKHIIIY